MSNFITFPKTYDYMLVVLFKSEVIAKLYMRAESVKDIKKQAFSIFPQMQFNEGSQLSVYKNNGYGTYEIVEDHLF